MAGRPPFDANRGDAEGFPLGLTALSIQTDTAEPLTVDCSGTGD